MRRSSFLAGLTLAAFAIPSAFGAQIGERTTPDGGVFAGACAGVFLSFIRPNPGVSAANFAGGTPPCQTNSSVPGGSASASVSNSGTYNNIYPYANSATATATPGFLRLGSDSDGSAASGFAGAIAEAGFNDRVTLGGGVGSGYWVLPVHVSGMMTATGSGARGSFQIGLYKNHNLVTASNGGSAYSLFAAMNSHNYGAGQEDLEDETMEYLVQQNYEPNTSTVSSLAINNTSYFIVPVTFGVSFEFALHANAWSGQISSGASSVQNQASVDFGHTIAYAGGAYFLGTDNSTITNLTYTSAAGFDYENAAVPEPATWFLAGLSLLVAAKYRNKLRRQ